MERRIHNRNRLERLIVTVALGAWAGAAGAASVFVNELHYDNAGADLDEAVEIAGTAGVDLTGWSIVLYNGGNGTAYQTVPLGGSIDDEGAGFGALGIAIDGIQNGAPDGLALVDAGGATREFLSYEGAFTAADGPAAGLASQDLGVAEDGSDPAGLSLQRIGTGQAAGDFTWSGPFLASLGELNSGQAIAPAPVPLPATLWSLLGGLAGLAFLRRRRPSGRPFRMPDRERARSRPLSVKCLRCLRKCELHHRARSHRAWRLDGAAAHP